MTVSDHIPTRTVWLQVLFWALVWFLIPFLFTEWEHADRIARRSLSTAIPITLVVGINLTVLLPRFFFRKQYGLYALSSIALVLAMLFLMEWTAMPWNDWLHPRPERRQSPFFRRGGDFSNFRIFARSFPLFISLLGSTLFEMAAYANRREKEAVQLQKEKLETEIKFLRSQINPHFLFNAMNNIYTLSVVKDDQTPDYLLKLSDMLRYVLYECNAERVPLHREIDYIKNYIDLQGLKDSRGLNVQTELDDTQPNLRVAPMLFIPFIENAFKHSKVEDLERGWIRIRLQAVADQIWFEVRNSLPAAEYSKDKTGGIGLANVRRQLELLYPGRHELFIERRADEFFVSLKIDLS